MLDDTVEEAKPSSKRREDKNLIENVRKSQDDAFNISAIENKKEGNSALLDKTNGKLNGTADSFLGDDELKNFLNEAKDDQQF